MKMNLPNKLTVLRLIMVPIFMAVMLIPCFAALDTTVSLVLNIVGVALFIIASFTDMLDGKIARKHNLVTDFGKFLDPLADKFMVIGAMICIFYANTVSGGNKNLAALYIFALIIVIFRELAVTSIRLVASSSGGVVIAANMLGKIKTVTQIIAVCAAIIEPMIYSALSIDGFVADFPPLTFVMTILMMIFTVISGINYIKGAWKFLDHNK